MQFDREKLRNLILYTASKCEPSQLGATKLHKVLYFADMLAHANLGQAITGASYRKRPHGPTCDALLFTLREMALRAEIEIDTENYHGFLKKLYVPLAEPDLSRFSGEQLAIADEAIEFVCKHNTARTISEFSHNRAWDMTEFGEVLPYASAFYMLPSQVSQEALDWAAGEADAIAAERSSTRALELEDYAAFRSRVQKAL